MNATEKIRNFHENNIMIILKNLMRNSYENLLSDNIIRTKQSRDDQFNYPSVGDMSGKHMSEHLINLLVIKSNHQKELLNFTLFQII